MTRRREPTIRRHNDPLLTGLVLAVLAWGSVTPGEEAGGRTTLEERFRKADDNGDGVLERGELRAALPFDAVDGDGDGRVTLEELRAWVRGRRGDRGPQSEVRTSTEKGEGFFALACTHSSPMAQASALVDADGSGWLDIVVACKRHIHLVRNDGGSFSTGFTARVDNANGWGLHDLDGDGRLDLFVAQSGKGDDLDVRINRGDGTFAPCDLGNETVGCTRNVVFADFDGDGLVDSYHSVSAFGTNHAGSELHPGLEDGRFGPDLVESVLDPPVPDFWYRQANGPSGCTGKWANKMFKGAVVRDLDRDGRPDLITTAYADLGFQDDRDLRFSRGWVNAQERGVFLLHNRSEPGTIRFAEVAKQALGDGAHGPTSRDWNAYAAIPIDFDRDGDFDLFVGAVLRGGGRRSIEDTRAVGLFENISEPGRIAFRDVTEASGFGRFNALPPRERALRSFASGQAIDVDNDGWTDLVLVNRRDAERTPHAHPHVFRNLGTGVFQEVPVDEHGLGHGGGGRDLCCGDLDGDGRIDVVINDGSVGGYEGADNTRVYLNRLQTGNAWIGLNVTASVKGSPAIGSRVEVRKQGTSELLGMDEIRTDFCYRSKRSPALHFGLGKIARVDVRVVTRYGQEKVFQSLEAGQVHLLPMAD